MKKLLVVSLFLISQLVCAQLQVKDVKVVKLGKRAELQISYKGVLSSDPVLTLKNNIVQVALSDGVVWPKIERKINLVSSGRKDTTLLAYQYTRKLARVRALLPFSLQGHSDVDLKMVGNKILVNFPVIAQVKAHKSVPAVSKKMVNKVNKYDEQFLEKLLAETEEGDNKLDKASEHKEFKPVVKKEVDQVKSSLAGLEKKNNSVKDSFSTVQAKKSKFSLVSYFGKFVVFLGVILLLFYGVLFLMRKGVLKKGKLGFLNNTSVITVLNTTYIGPKRSLMLVKVHNQVFLISSTEKGIEFLSEVKDTTGLLKQGEKEVAGSNFDIALNAGSDSDTAITLKEDITKSTPVDEGNAILNTLKKGVAKDQVRFSEQIKKKVKGLKPLQ